MGNKLLKKEQVTFNTEYNTIYNITKNQIYKKIHVQFKETQYCNIKYAEYLLKNLQNDVENTGADSDHIFYRITCYTKESYKECLTIIKVNSEIFKIIKR